VLPAGAQTQVDPSDLAQNVLIRVDRALADYRGSSDPEFHAWIKTILRNQAIDVLRARTSEVLFEASEERLTSIDQRSTTSLSSVPSTGISPVTRGYVRREPVDVSGVKIQALTR
jgi:DNA-directed RNA polymerase specialized sigma24 family protein